MRHPFPSESAARLRVEKLYLIHMNNIRLKLHAEAFFLMSDESEIRSMKCTNILTGLVDEPTSLMLWIVCRFVNLQTVSQCIYDAVKILDSSCENFLLLTTDAAPYMITAGKILYFVFRHAPCHVHRTALTQCSYENKG